MIRSFFKYFSALIFFSIVFFSCVGGRENAFIRPDLYKTPAKDELKISLAVIHADDKFSWLYYEINSDEIQYKKADHDSLFTATLKIGFRIWLSSGVKQISDTGNLFIREKLRNTKSHTLKGRLKIKIQAGIKGLVEITAFDVNSGIKTTRTFFLNKENKLTEQNFSACHSDSSFMFEPFLKRPGTIFLTYERNSLKKKLKVDFFKVNSVPPAPPYLSVKEQENSYKPDSSFVVSKSEDIFQLKIEKKGIYHCRPDTAFTDGVSFFYFDNDFPEVKSTNRMVECLRYVMKDEEYSQAINTSNKKEAIEKFWFDIAGNTDRAGLIFSAYLKRVSQSNTFFSASAEGWKTDRGMIWIIFGPPKTIYKSAKAEEWTYEEKNKTPVTFTFKKQNNPFSENDLTLERNILFQKAWFEAVDNWRQGRINFVK